MCTQPPAHCSITESLFENPKCHIPEKPFGFTPDAAPAHDCGRVALRVFVSDLTAVVVSADDQLPLAGGFVRDIESEDSAVDFEIHLLVRESVVEPPTSHRMESELRIASVFDSDLFEVFQNVVGIPFRPDAVSGLRDLRSTLWLFVPREEF